MESSDGFKAMTPKVAMMPNSASSLEVSLLETKVSSRHFDHLKIFSISHSPRFQVVRKFATPLRKADPNI